MEKESFRETLHKDFENNFQRGILKSIVGSEKANMVLQSMSMNAIPAVRGTNSLGGGVKDALQASKSHNGGLDNGMFRSQIIQLQKNIDKKTKQRGISQYMAEDGEGSSDNSEFDDNNEDDVFGDKSMMAEKDPSKLIDLELVKLLKFCNTLKNDNQNKEEYQDELMMKGLSVGKKSKDKLLILDMDETMIATQFGGKETKGFVETFNFSFSDTSIKVRVRPFCTEMLEKLSQFYEIIAWTAGVKDYADPILDYIDPEKKFFKMRLYRDTCIKVDQFYIKDLDVILDRTKEAMVIVDNSILSFSFDLQNGVPINSYMGNEPDDRDLLYLVSFLEEAFYEENIQEACEKSFKLSYLLSTIAETSTTQS